MQLVSGLPEDLSAAVAVALHVPEESPSALPSILSRNGPLTATHAADGEGLVALGAGPGLDGGSPIAV